MKKILKIFPLFFLFLFLSACSFPDLFKDKEIEIETINHISTVVLLSNIKVTTETYENIFGFEKAGPYSGSGSGVIFFKLNNDYYVLTNAHVVDLSEYYHHRIKVEDINGKVYNSSLIAISQEMDLAILKFQSDFAYEPIEFSSKNPQVGEIVFSVGSPSGQSNIITAGNIIDYREIDQVDYEIIFHNALVRNGSSGSMLINERFEIVGLNTWGFKGDEADGEDFIYGGATPIEKILEFIDFEELK